MIRILREKLPEAFDRISATQDLFLPVKKAGEVNYGKYEKGAEVSLDTLKTVRSAKDFFFPQSETMMKFKLSGKNIEIKDIRKERAPFVVFGVRGCDLKSFSILDNVFLQEPVDTFYKARREAATIVTLACNKPEISCFCKNFGIDAAEPAGDATAYADDKYLYIEANTEKGEKLLTLLKEVSEEDDGKAAEEIKKQTREIIEKLPYSNLDLSRFKHENLNELFNLPDWQELSEACLGCGTCTFVCPTCQCFDIRDFKTNEGVTVSDAGIPVCTPTLRRWRRQTRARRRCRDTVRGLCINSYTIPRNTAERILAWVAADASTNARNTSISLK